jgi:4-diphosphocytidyl-2C-methyl-D-erythritol kinase
MVSDTTALRKALSQKGAPDTKLLLANMKNALQDPAISLHPKIQEILNIVQNTVTADHVQMSGSGPTIVAYYLAEHMHTLPDDVRLLKAILKDYGCLICFAPLLS